MLRKRMYFNCMFVSNTKRGWAYISGVALAYYTQAQSLSPSTARGGG